MDMDVHQALELQMELERYKEAVATLKHDLLAMLAECKADLNKQAQGHQLH